MNVSVSRREGIKLDVDVRRKAELEVKERGRSSPGCRMGYNCAAVELEQAYRAL